MGRVWILSAFALAALQDAREVPATRIQVSCRDARGLSFDVKADGRVELLLRHEDAKAGRVSEKLYTADSFSEFRRRYPDIVKAHRLERFVPFEADPEGLEELHRLLRKWRELVGPGAWGPEMQRVMERVGPGLAGTDGTGPAGVRVERLPPALAVHLKVTGLLVTAVDAEGPASESGLRIHDVILEFDGAAVGDPASFAERLAKSLGGEFSMKVLREGEPRTLEVQPRR